MELRECPFCRDRMIAHSRGDVGNLHWALCGFCRVEGPARMSWEEAVEAWNTRASDTAIKELVEALESLISRMEAMGVSMSSERRTLAKYKTPSE